MNCVGCKYSRNVESTEIFTCIQCKRGYKEDSKQYKVFKDRFEKQPSNMATIEELNKIADKLPVVVLNDINSRIGDWLLSGGKEDDPYIEQQLRYAQRFVS